MGSTFTQTSGSNYTQSGFSNITRTGGQSNSNWNTQRNVNLIIFINFNFNLKINIKNNRYKKSESYIAPPTKRITATSMSKSEIVKNYQAGRPSTSRKINLTGYKSKSRTDLSQSVILNEENEVQKNFKKLKTYGEDSRFIDEKSYNSYDPNLPYVFYDKENVMNSSNVLRRSIVEKRDDLKKQKKITNRTEVSTLRTSIFKQERISEKPVLSKKYTLKK